MAREYIFFDDLDETQGAETYTFALNGDTYEIDLNDDNYKALEESLAKYIEKGRKVTARLPRERSASSKSSTSPEEKAAIRQWAASQGIGVSARGRISREVMEAYNKAH